MILYRVRPAKLLEESQERLPARVDPGVAESLKLLDVAVEHQRVTGLEIVAAKDLLDHPGILPKIVTGPSIAEVEVAQDHDAVSRAERDPGSLFVEPLEGSLD